MNKIRLSKYAIKDLKDIYAYTKQEWGETNAEKYIDILWKELERLKAFPKAHRLRDDIYPDCRMSYQGRHVILYRADKRGIDVARILHERMALKQHIPSEYLKND